MRNLTKESKWGRKKRVGEEERGRKRRREGGEGQGKGEKTYT
jgi:hypothetical protein